MPLMVARHCSRVEKPQFLPPPSLPYWAHQGYSIAALAGLADINTMPARIKNADPDFCMPYVPVARHLPQSINDHATTRRITPAAAE